MNALLSTTIITVAVIAATVVLAVDGALPGEAAAGLLGAAIPTTAALANKRGSGTN